MRSRDTEKGLEETPDRLVRQVGASAGPPEAVVVSSEPHWNSQAVLGRVEKLRGREEPSVELSWS